MGRISDADIQHLIDIGEKGETGFITDVLAEIQTLRELAKAVGAALDIAHKTIYQSMEDGKCLKEAYENWKKL